MTRRLLINGRFLGGKQTAVNAVAHALTDQLCRDGGSWEVEVVVPPSLAKAKVPAEWSLCPIGTRNGIAWEQQDLPKLRDDGVIAGFFNTVPLRGRGYVTMLHDAHVLTTPGSYGAATRFWRTALMRRAGALGNHVLTVSDHSRQDLLRHGIGSPDQIGVVPNGAGQVTKVCPDASILTRLDLHPEQPYCVALSTLMPHKNISILLRAFALSRLAGVMLVLFGAADRKAFEDAGLAAPQNVIFAGKLRDAELAALYRNALATCMPSTAEGFGLPALETMALGRPTIIAPCGALPEVVGDTGLAAAPDDPEAWADRILHLVKDSELHRRLCCAAQKRAAHFTWEAAGQAVLTHLDRWFPAMPQPTHQIHLSHAPNAGTS